MIANDDVTNINLAPVNINQLNNSDLTLATPARPSQ